MGPSNRLVGPFPRSLILPKVYFFFDSGKAISILRGTLPDFFSIGLVTRLEDDPTPIAADHPSSIYANNIRLMYTPPHLTVPLLPKVAQIEGTLFCFPQLSSHPMNR